MLRIEHLTKTFGNGFTAVSDLTLHVEKGDIYGFIGHNGAGKTTTLRCVTGILNFEKGSIAIDGHDAARDPLACKRVTAYIPDNPDLYDYLTAMQYLDFVADVYGVSSEQRRARVGKYAAMFGIEGRLGELISSFSHGMKQKVALIAALLHDPKLLVLDEPFVGLDPKAAHDLKGVMRELCEGGSAIFFSTHVLEVAEKLCNKIAVIKNGCLVAAGGMDAVKGSASLEDLFLELTE